MQLDLFLLEENYKPLSGITQVCKICSKEKDMVHFNKHKNFQTGIDNRCRACIKKESKVRNELKERFKHLKKDTCACCGKTHPKSMVCDHDHNTLKFRGWICDPCNMGIGKLGDDLEGIEKALAYLKGHYERT